MPQNFRLQVYKVNTKCFCNVCKTAVTYTKYDSDMQSYSSWLIGLVTLSRKIKRSTLRPGFDDEVILLISMLEVYFSIRQTFFCYSGQKYFCPANDSQKGHIDFNFIE